MEQLTWLPIGWGLAFAAVLVFAADEAAAKDHPYYEPKMEVSLGKNLFRNAAVTASGHWKKQVPGMAVDGSVDRGRHWACENIPVRLTVDLKKPAGLDAIRLWTWWGSGRYYQFHIEGSLDGKSWKTLVDQRENVRPSDEAGWTFFFDMAQVRYVRTTFTRNSAGNRAGGHIVEIEGYAVGPRKLAELAALAEGWACAGDGLLGAVGSADVRYARDRVPRTDGTKKWAAAAWRGERVSGQFVLWTRSGARQVRLSAGPLVSKSGGSIPASCVRPFFVRYVLGDGKLWPDVLDTQSRIDLPASSARPVWLSVDVPPDAEPGLYTGKLKVARAGGGGPVFDIQVEVLPNVLPEPGKWSFHLDLWQHPWAVASYHRVEPWSVEHWSLLESVLRTVAGAGQKCLTTTIVHKPWNQQTFDAFESMVKWTRHEGGRWSFDYTLFDKYVQFGAGCGLDGQISCYSMVPWGNRIHYHDARTGDFKSVAAAPGTQTHAKMWTAFLKDFSRHMKQRGWFERVCIAMDERPLRDMLHVVSVVRKAAPGLKLALAGTPHEELFDEVHDYCIFISHRVDPAVLQRRARHGRPTTYYICCGPRRPNTFTFSPPAQAAWLGWFAAARGYSGLLRWAFNHWNRDPLVDTSYGSWPAGDCFLIYPGPRSSIRFERLREGIQDYEKIRILRAALKKLGPEGRKDLKRLDERLTSFQYPKAGRDEELAENVRKARELLLDLSRAAGNR